MQNLQYEKAWIYICIKCADIDINILNIICTVQFKIPDFFALPELLQQYGQEEKDKVCAAIVMVFVYPSQILPKNVYMLERSAFKSLWLPINKNNCKKITNVIV